MFLEKGARKKKCLTDPVDILPFTGQNLRDAAPKPVAKPNAPLPRIDNIKPQPKILTVPTGQLNTSNLSIKQMYAQETEKRTNVSPENLPRESFSTDQLKMAWRQFAFKMREDAKETVYHAMVKRDPLLLENSLIRFEVDNVTQEGSIHRILQDMSEHFRKELNNYDIVIETFVSENPDAEQQFLSPKDKFTALARKYPNLHSFKQAFNLDFEY